MENNVLQLKEQIDHQGSLLAKQKRTLQKIILLFALSTVCIGSLFISAFTDTAKDDVIRTKGIVIVDEKGRDRILIGAPFPYSKARVRTDFQKAYDAWAKNFGGNFDWYKTNKSILNEGNGMLVLDENGHDRVAIGSPIPTAYIGRIAPSHGITVNDETGTERGGWGLLKNDHINRMVLGMDHISGYEAATIGVMEDGSTDIRLNDPNSTNRLDIMNDKGQIAKWNKYKTTTTGIVIKDSLGKPVKTISAGDF